MVERFRAGLSAWMFALRFATLDSRPWEVILSALIALVLWTVGQPGTLVMELPVSPETPEGELLVAQRAIAHCAGKYPLIGRYRFEGTQVQGAAGAKYRYETEISCLDRPPERAPATAAAVPADWKASAQDVERLEAATRAYFAAVDAGDIARIESMMTAGQRDVSTTADRRATNAEFRRAGGRPGEHRIVRITWYVNPPGAEPGAYAAVDFDRRYAKLAVSCGYVAWRREGDGSYRLVREEIGQAPRTASMSPGEMSRLRAMLRCRD